MKDMMLILNYSDEFSMEIARRLRSEQIYTRIVDAGATAEQIRKIAPKGIILSGSEKGMQGTFDAGILELGIPVLALGHASHLLLTELGGACAGVALSDKKAMVEYGESMLFSGLSSGERYIEEAQTMMLPPDVQMIASAGGCTIAYEHTQKKQYGIQFELERNDPESSAILTAFVRDVCECDAWWTQDAVCEEAQSGLRDAAASGGNVVCAVSGGVDSTVAALLTHKVFGSRMTAIFVDNGLMREGETAAVRALFEELGIPLYVSDRSQEVLHALSGKLRQEEKDAVVKDELNDEMIRQSALHEAKILVLGTNYSDFLQSGSGAESWQESGMTVVEPLLELFKEEVREIGAMLGMSEGAVTRKPFPALGLGARILGEVTAERLHALRTAEAVFSEEIRLCGLDRKLYKYFPVLIGLNEKTGGETMVLRAVTLSGGQLIPARLPYDLVERTVQRIMGQFQSVVRVFYDQTPTQLGKETFL